VTGVPTTEEIERARSLRAHGHQWATIARAVGRSATSIRRRLDPLFAEGRKNQELARRKRRRAERRQSKVIPEALGTAREAPRDRL
jgi:hypothetical protein